MNGFTSQRFLILITVVFPILLLAAAVYLGSNILAIVAILVWIGIGVVMIYLPYAKE
jgi:hypothetical protein